MIYNFLSACKSHIIILTSVNYHICYLKYQLIQGEKPCSLAPLKQLTEPGIELLLAYEFMTECQGVPR